MNTDRELRLKINTHSLAIFSIMVYLLLSVVFEWNSKLSYLASFVMYFCLTTCGLHVLQAGKFRVEKFIAIAFFFGLVLTLSLFYSPTSTVIKNTYIYRYWTTFVLLTLISNVIESHEDIKALLIAYVLSGVASSVSVYIQFGFDNLVAGLSRFGSDLGNQNLIGMYGAFAISLGIYFFVHGGKKTRMLYIIFVAICLPSVMFSGSRKAILIIAISVVIFFLTNKRDKKLIKRVVLGTLVIALIILLIEKVPAFNAIKVRFVELLALFTSGESQLKGDINRINYIDHSIQGFLMSPLIGQGFYYSYYLFGAYSHNNFTELMLNNGLIGFLLYYSLHMRIFLYSKKNLAVNYRVEYSLISMLISGILVCDIGVVTYYNRYIFILLLLCEKLCLYTASTYLQKRQTDIRAI